MTRASLTITRKSSSLQLVLGLVSRVVGNLATRVHACEYLTGFQRRLADGATNEWSTRWTRANTAHRLLSNN